MFFTRAARSAKLFPRAEFATTPWSVVIAARDGTPSAARPAMATLCEAYWYPIYAYIRRQGYAADQAEELTQEFFSRLVDRKFLLKGVDPSKGSLRSLLKVACKRLLAGQNRGQPCGRPGGRRQVLSIDAASADEQYALEPADYLTPERQFDRDYAVALLRHVLHLVRQNWEKKGHRARFERLEHYLVAEPDCATSPQIASELSMTPDAVRQAIHRLRDEFRSTLRSEVMGTVTGPGQVEDEIRDLFASLGE